MKYNKKLTSQFENIFSQSYSWDAQVMAVGPISGGTLCCGFLQVSRCISPQIVEMKVALNETLPKRTAEKIPQSIQERF